MKNLLSSLVICFLGFNVALANECDFTIEFADQLDHAENLRDAQIANWKSEKIDSHENKANEICNQACGTSAVLSTESDHKLVHTNPLCEWRGGCIDKLVVSLKTSASCLE